MMGLNVAENMIASTADFKPRSAPEIVSIDCLRCFPELVRQLGGDPNAVLARALIGPDLLNIQGSSIEYRSLLNAMQYAAEALDCPDFGLRLAVMQGGNKSIGPIGVVMKNSTTLGQAIGYCAKNIHAYSVATKVRFEPDRSRHLLLVRLEILLDRVPDKRQAVEHALMLASLNMRELSGGGARVRKVLFSHEPQMSPKAYRQFFGCDVHFEQKADGLVLTEDDLLCPVVDPDSRVYEMATSFIETRFPHMEASIRTRVRSLVEQYIGSKDCTNERVAADFCLHPRTLQRRLRAEGTSFEDLKDEIRRDLALRYIQDGDMPLKRVAEKLGYAETSVLSRSCFRWFSSSPREMRAQHKADAALERGLVACSANSHQSL
jgi:AraC-like DNA-binding protein